MNRFADSRAALEFLVSRIVAEARRRNVPLSDVERDMLYFSETDWTLPNISEVNDQFEAEYNEVEYEVKITRLISSIWERGPSENPQELDGWRDALEILGKEDRYLLLMVPQEFPYTSSIPNAPRPAPASNRWMATLAAVVVGATLFYIEMRFAAPVTSSFAVLVLPLLVCPALAYSVVRILARKK